MPLPQAICKLLYTFCKIRGSQVVSRFFANEPKYLEPMLDAFHAWATGLDSSSDTSALVQERTTITWEVNYIFMLWLSHLLFTPFDLHSLDSVRSSSEVSQLEDLSLPSGLPNISVRLISLATASLSSAGKEREAGVTLLVRLALRPDMRQVGLHDTLIQWTRSWLKATSSGQRSGSIYTSIGVLSFLAGVVKSADIGVIGPFLLGIYESIANLSTNESEGSKEILSSALSRKAMIKIYCAISVTTIQHSLSSLHIPDYVLEEVIDYLLTCLSDNDTPVRHAASKALSIITAKLDHAMAAEISDAVISCLDENVLWDDIEAINKSTKDLEPVPIAKERERNLTAVSPLRWQGLILTLSHLLFRRSPPAFQLPGIVNSLILALGFEQRSSSGNSIGANVRDAACFGIWSLARRYTTAELLNVDTSSVRAAEAMNRSISILQILAMELVTTATVDPSGNIRRGASAALQELIGRHPDTIVEGISLVQTVDYHAVALRSRAVNEVAISAAMLDSLYWQDVLNGLLSWRGIGAVDSDSRRQAAHAIGQLCRDRNVDDVTIVIDVLYHKLDSLNAREIEKRHGLLLAIVAIVEEASSRNESPTFGRIWKLFDSTSILTERDFTSPILRPELTAEAVCSLIHVLASAPTRKGLVLKPPKLTTINTCVRYLELSLYRRERIVVTNASQAAKAIFDLVAQDAREKLLGEWIEKCLPQNSGVGTKTLGYLAALGAVYESQTNGAVERDRIVKAILSNIVATADIETKVEALRSLTEGVLPFGSEGIIAPQ